MIVALTGFMGCGKSSVGRELSTLLGIPVIDLDKYIVQRVGRSIPDIFSEFGESGFRDLETFCLSEVLSGGCTLGNVLRTPPKRAWVPPSYVAEGGTVSEGTSPGHQPANDSVNTPYAADGGTVSEGTSPGHQPANDSVNGISLASKDGRVPEGRVPAGNFILSLGGGTIIREENRMMIKENCTCFFLRATVETLRTHLGGEQSQRPLLKGGGFESLLQERTPLYTEAADFVIDTDALTPMQIAGIIANLLS